MHEAVDSERERERGKCEDASEIFPDMNKEEEEERKKEEIRSEHDTSGILRSIHSLSLMYREKEKRGFGEAGRPGKAGVRCVTQTAQLDSTGTGIESAY